MFALAVCYGYIALVQSLVILSSPVYCATHCIEHGIRGVCLPLTSWHLLCVCVSRKLRLCCHYARTFHIVCIRFVCYTLHSSWDSRVCVPLNSRYLLCVYVRCVIRLCFPVPKTCRVIFTGVLCYTLHNTWDSRVCVALTSRHPSQPSVRLSCGGCWVGAKSWCSSGTPAP